VATIGIPISRTRPDQPAAAPLPQTLFGYIWRYSSRHQLLLAALSVAVFLLNTAPLEIQRRIVNDAVARGATATILWLALTYVAVALAEGALKLVLNIYRGWVSENAVRHLRRAIHALVAPGLANGHAAEAEGVEISMILSESEPVGGFVGTSTSEPLLQGGILLTVFGYMTYLQPEIALISLAVFSPQFAFVPLIQRAINRRVRSRIQVLREVSGGIILGSHDPAFPAAVQDARIDTVFTLNMGIYKLKFSMNFLMNLMHHLGVAAVLGIGGWQAARGEVELGTVVAFVSGLAKVNDPWGEVVNWFREMMVVTVKYDLIVDTVAQIGAAAPADTDAGQQ
jgi:ABC-type bacteriocin/lantibiotic exporter with double-glycine peptidase domain